MRGKWLVLSVIAACLIGSLLYMAYVPPLLAQPAAEAKSVKIGVISPQSGPLAFEGIGVLRAVDLAVKNIDEKGTSGKGPGILVGNQRYNLEVVSYDDAGDPAKSVAGMRRLVELDKIHVMVGPFGTPQVWACQTINTQLGVLFNGISKSDLSRKKGNPLYIQERVPNIYFGDALAQACIDKGYKKACVVSDIVESYSALGQRFKAKFESLGGQVVGFETADIKNTQDYHSVMTKMKAKRPEIMFIAMYDVAMALAAAHAFDAGYNGKFLFSSDWGPNAEKMIGLERIEGSLVHAYTTTFYGRYPDQDKKGHSVALQKQWKQSYNEEVRSAGVVVYDIPWMFARAMEIAGAVTDVQAIRSACPAALQEKKLPLVFPNTDVLKNGLLYGAPDMLLEIKGGGYKVIQELSAPRELLE